MNLDQFLSQQIENGDKKMITLSAQRLDDDVDTVRLIADSVALATHTQILREKLAMYRCGESVVISGTECNYIITPQISADGTITNDEITRRPLTFEQQIFQKDMRALENLDKN